MDMSANGVLTMDDSYGFCLLDFGVSFFACQKGTTIYVVLLFLAVVICAGHRGVVSKNYETFFVRFLTVKNVYFFSDRC